MVRTGASAYLGWGFESTFGGGSVSRNKIFGLDQKITSITHNNNPIPVAALNSLTLSQYAFAQNRFQLSIDAILSNPWVFQMILNTLLTTGASAPFTHTFSLGASDKTPKSFDVEIGFAAETENAVRRLQGAILQNMTISSSIGAAARCTYEIASGIMPTIGTSLGSAGTDSENLPYTFVHGTLELPDGTGVNQVQSVELTIDPQSDLLYAHGSFAATDAYRKLLMLSARFNKSQMDRNFMNAVTDATLGRKEAWATLALKYTTGAGATLKEIDIQGTGVISPSISNPYEPGEPVFEDVELQFRTVQVVAQNPTSAAP